MVVCILDEQGMSHIERSTWNYGKAIFPPPEGAENIMDILNCDPRESGDMNFKEKLIHVPLPLGSHCFPSIDPLRASQDVSVFNIDAVIREVNKSGAKTTSQVILDKFDNLYDLINEREGNATLSKNKVERLIHQLLRPNDCREVGSQLNDASHQLDAENTHYKELKAKLGQVASRIEELQKDLQSLDGQKKDLSCQAVPSEDLLQEAEQAVIDLKRQIDTLSAIEIIDLTTKASIEKTEAYVKELFED
ncbi:hypothetical protein Cgig2_006442 [Carnegiea gigantea]|uniref:Uncharacterized protein n=1 Tax=Carnegiea gigantea TaxID=171969 RepID=A0A9Q1JFK6_9CARY|nr:hypothetical protein Cgig2_006442 [Carnegiea gigantea]